MRAGVFGATAWRARHRLPMPNSVGNRLHGEESHTLMGVVRTFPGVLAPLSHEAEPGKHEKWEHRAPLRGWCVHTNIGIDNETT